MSYAKGKNFNLVFLPLRYSAGDTYSGSGLVQHILPTFSTICYSTIAFDVVTTVEHILLLLHPVCICQVNLSGLIFKF